MIIIIILLLLFTFLLHLALITCFLLQTLGHSDFLSSSWLLLFIVFLHPLHLLAPPLLGSYYFSVVPLSPLSATPTFPNLLPQLMSYQPLRFNGIKLLTTFPKPFPSSEVLLECAVPIYPDWSPQLFSALPSP